jgi:hypothetical protein
MLYDMVAADELVIQGKLCWEALPVQLDLPYSLLCVCAIQLSAQVAILQCREATFLPVTFQPAELVQDCGLQARSICLHFQDS